MNTKQTMLSVAQARDFLLNAAKSVSDIEWVATLAANGRVLAQDQVSMIDVPSADNTQMDGYAVRAADCANADARLRISQRIPAGHVGQRLAPGTAARIFTGALIPAGADAVVMQEQCRVEVEGEDHFVSIAHAPKLGEWVRRQGEDIRQQACILTAGTRLRPQELGLAASVGLATLPVFRKLRVALFFTGDELSMPGEVLKPGAIYNSNRFLLTGLLQNLACEISDFGIVPDQLDATRATLRKAAQDHDLIITSGGVSVGEEDHIRPAVQAEGRIDMWQIAVKPGKPLAFGEVYRGGQVSEQQAQSQSKGAAFFLGLPGNPVSSFVTFCLFVRPFVLRMQNVANSLPQAQKMRADFAWPRADKRNEFLRAKRNASGGLSLFPNQSSGVLTSTVWGDGLIDLAAGQTIVEGDLVDFIPFSEFDI